MQSITEDIKKQQFKKVYLLYGDESYLKRYYKDQLTMAIVPKGDTMNYTYYEGKSVNYNEVIDIAETMPFFADRRIIVLENTGFFKNACLPMAEYMAAIPESTCFLFVEEEIDKRSKMFKAVKEYGYVCEMGRQSEDKLSRWVLGLISKEKKKITKETMMHLLEVTGTDMDYISMELEKLISYTLDQDVITKADIDLICTPQITGKIFEMIDAIGEQKQSKALSLYYDLIALKEPPMRILFMLSRQFNMMLQIAELASKGYTKESISSKTGIQGFVVGKCMKQIKYFNKSMIRKALQDSVDTEEAVKSGRLDEKMGVEMLLITYSSKIPNNN